MTERAAAARAEEIADGFIASFTLGAGQFCTKPGVLLAPAGSALTARLATAESPGPVPLLNDRIAEGHRRSRAALADRPGVAVLGAPEAPGDVPTLLVTTAATLLADLEGLFVECFGPTALVATYADERELVDVAEAIDGRLTATLQAEPDDVVVPVLTEVLAHKAGRLLWNHWPTGVSVTAAQQHGGPYPASTAPGTTSVGTAAIERFVRPVAWQGFPDHLLPPELREEPAR
ncbi:hypothetical protein [Nocardioides convexus]|uniref:hypothetical protein n=1 Tax=Nocardioides convexus TaxID=2712224 RepID=UPI00241823E1|nr:hypothetical protein [Nocardioides convexus]